jgi:hypothetical protein
MELAPKSTPSGAFWDLYTPMAEDLCQEVEHEWQVDSDQQHQPVVFPQIVEPWLQH